MARRHIRGDRKSLRRTFAKGPLRHLSRGTKKYAIKTLGRFNKSGGGINTGRELNKAYRRWRRNKKDPVSDAEARVIRRTLRKSKEPSSDPSDRPTSRLAMRPPPQQDFNADPRANLDERPSPSTNPNDPRDPSNWQDPAPPGLDSGPPDDNLDPRR